jgi:hypothetical protein
MTKARTAAAPPEERTVSPASVPSLREPRLCQLHAVIEQQAEQVPLFLKQLLLLLQQGEVLCLQAVKQIDQFLVAPEQAALVRLKLLTTAIRNQGRPIQAQALQRKSAERREGVQ